jgi:hypothetical protein
VEIAIRAEMLVQFIISRESMFPAATWNAQDGIRGAAGARCSATLRLLTVEDCEEVHRPASSQFLSHDLHHSSIKDIIHLKFGGTCSKM